MVEGHHHHHLVSEFNIYIVLLFIHYSQYCCLISITIIIASDVRQNMPAAPLKLRGRAAPLKLRGRSSIRKSLLPCGESVRYSLC